MNNPVDETQATSDMLDDSSGRLSQCDTGFSDVVDFARSRVDIFEDPMSSGCKAIVNLADRGMVTGMMEVNGRHNADFKNLVILPR